MQSQCRLILANADQYVQSQYSRYTAQYSPFEYSPIIIWLYWDCIGTVFDCIGTVIDCIWTVLGCTARTVLLLHVLVSIGPYWPGLTCIRTVLAYIYVIHKDCIGTVLGLNRCRRWCTYLFNCLKQTTRWAIPAIYLKRSHT